VVGVGQLARDAARVRGGGRAHARAEALGGGACNVCSGMRCHSLLP
jgi:hypothetical protein